MIDFRSINEWKRIWRYYGVGVVNTIFGYGLFSFLLFIELDVYLAQALSHVLGVAFNYALHSRYVFRVRNAPILLYVGSYAANYLASLAMLSGFLRFGVQPYLAGLSVIVLVSAANFVLLRTLVFRGRQTFASEE